MMLRIVAFLRNHTHYWGIPHQRSGDAKMIQTCYECGAEREVKIQLAPSLDEILAPLHDDHLAA